MRPTVTEKLETHDNHVTHLLVSDECGVLVNITLDPDAYRCATTTARADLVTQVLKALSWPPKDDLPVTKWELFPYRRNEDV